MPGLKGALSVRVNDGQTDRIVTRYCRGLKFTKTAPGGHRDLSFTMVLPRNTFTDLGPDDNCWVYDSRTGRLVFGQAYLENPTPTDGPNGQQFDVHAFGGMVRASDETRMLIYVDQTLDGWVKESISAASADIEVGNASGNPGVQTIFPGGSVVTPGMVSAAGYRRILAAGMNIGAIRIFSGAGKIDTNWRQHLFTDTQTFAVNLTTGITTAGMDQTWFVGGTYNNSAGGTSVLAACQRAGVQLYRVGASTTIGDDLSYGNFVLMSVLGQRMDRNGTLLTGSAGLGGTALSVLASQVVEDLLGRLLTFCDAATAQVDVTAFAITQLAWPDGVKAADVLNQLSVFESGYLWEILDSNDAGKHRFNYRAWPTTPRYEISTRDGFKQTGSDVDLCNRILVTWNDASGAPQVTPVTAASLGLVGIGLPVDQISVAPNIRVKDADPISLPDGFGSTANATRIGGQILTDKINPPKAGTALVRRPILDQLTGNLVMPWEIEPGYLVRVRETGDDLRLTQVDYDDDTCSSVLTLGQPVLTDEQRLARLDRAARKVVHLLGLPI